MRARNPEVAARKPTASSCVSNGRDILAALVSDQGGADRMIVQLCRRFAALARMAEQLEAGPTGLPLEVA